MFYVDFHPSITERDMLVTERKIFLQLDEIMPTKLPFSKEVEDWGGRG